MCFTGCMVKANNISHEQAIAAVSVIYQELKVLFKLMNISKKIPDDAAKRKQILSNLKHILQKGHNIDLTDNSIFDIFDSSS